MRQIYSSNNGFSPHSSLGHSRGPGLARFIPVSKFKALFACFLSFPVAVMKTPQQKRLNRESVYFSSQIKVLSVMEGLLRWQELAIAGHI